MCDEGRYGFHHVHSDLRLTTRCRDARRREGCRLGLVRRLGRDRPTVPRRRPSWSVLCPLTVEGPGCWREDAGGRSEAAVVLGPCPCWVRTKPLKNGFTLSGRKVPEHGAAWRSFVRHFMAGSPRSLTPVDQPPKHPTTPLTRHTARNIWVSGGYKDRVVDPPRPHPSD